MRRAHQRGPSPVTAGVIGLIATLVIVYFGFTKYDPFYNPTEVKAAFRTVNDLKKNSKVRVAGINVGKVTNVESLPGGKGAVVTMEIEDAGVPIHTDAQMKIRPRIFLEGNWFVDISPGSPSAPLLDEGEMIPATQTSAPVQFGQLLTALQSDTREDLQVILDEYGRALQNGGAKAANRSIAYWRDAFRGSAIVNEATLGEVEHDLTNYIRGADKFARGLNRDPEALKALITDLATTMQAIGSEDRNLAAAIEELPRTLIVGQRALGELNQAFPPLRRLVADMRPTVRSSGPALDAQYPLLQQLRKLVSKEELPGLIRDLRPTVPPLIELNEGGVDLQKQLRLASSCAVNVLVPWRNDEVPDEQFPASGPVYQEQVKWMPGIAAESRSFDANGQYVRSLGNGAEYAYGLNDGRFLVSGAPIQGVNPPKAESPPLRRDPCETQERPDLRSQPGQPPTAIRVNYNLPQVKAAQAKAREEAIKWLRSDIKRLGLNLKVGETPILREDIPKLPRATAVKR